MTVGELERRMTSDEFTDWVAFVALEKMDQADAVENRGLMPVVIVED